MIKKWTDDTWEDYLYWQSQDRKTLKRINQLILGIDCNRYTGVGKPEPLKHEFKGFWSRQIDDCNRIVHCINESCIEIIQCGSHYRDKCSHKKRFRFGSSRSFFN